MFSPNKESDRVSGGDGSRDGSPPGSQDPVAQSGGRGATVVGTGPANRSRDAGPVSDIDLMSRMFAEELSLDGVDPDADLTLLGAHSLVMVRVCTAWAARTGRRVDGASLVGSETIRDIVDRSTTPGAPPVDDLDVREHRFDVPLDHDHPDGPVISVFARSVRRAVPRGRSLPHLLFLQGGPGGQCADPRVRLPAWLDVALDHYQVVLLDQRGGGRSGVVNEDLIRGLSAPEAAERLRCFRADSIVRDAEILRERILGVARWTLLGESYGGALTLTYLSLFPDGLDQVLVSSGLLGPLSDADTVMRETLAVARKKNSEYYELYPEDAEAVDRVVEHLKDADVRLPTGERLTPERLAMLGVKLGFDVGPDTLHELIRTAWSGDRLAESFLAAVAASTVFSTSPLFYLQEYIYGAPGRATGWAAWRLCSEDPATGPDARPFFFHGEVFFPWMFEQIEALRPFAPVADELARFTGWNSLYNRERLRRNTVPVYAVAVAEDLYVPLGEQIRTSGEIGCCWLMVSPARGHASLMDDRDTFSRLLAFASAGGTAHPISSARHDSSH